MGQLKRELSLRKDLQCLADEQFRVLSLPGKFGARSLTPEGWKVAQEGKS